MASPEEQATALKNQGNKAFAEHDWPTAIDFYTKAIELNDKEPTFFTNRAQVCLSALVFFLTRVSNLSRYRHRPTSSLKHTVTLSQIATRHSN